MKLCAFLRDSGTGRELQTMGPKQRKIFFQRPQERSEELSAEMSRECRTKGEQVRLHDFVCAEVYSLCCQGYQHEVV